MGKYLFFREYRKGRGHENAGAEFNVNKRRGRKAALMPGSREESGVIALAGNPNVGKSTVFNALTGMRQHTGNWAGKTVVCARGRCRHGEREYVLVDLPGCYSLDAHSADEEAARIMIQEEHPGAVIVVCDATCLERNLILALQIMALTPRVVLCVNLLDEAEKKGITVDLNGLSIRMGIPVIGTAARQGRGLNELMACAARIVDSKEAYETASIDKRDDVESTCANRLDEVNIAQHTEGFNEANFTRTDKYDDIEDICEDIDGAVKYIQDAIFCYSVGLRDDRAQNIANAAERLHYETVHYADMRCHSRDRLFDRIFSGRWTAFPVMLAVLTVIFGITLYGANIPTQMIGNVLFRMEPQLAAWLSWVGASPWWVGLLTEGMYRVLVWVISVMLPPMAIFFPLFTLLEDSGYLPRVAFNLDKIFKKCDACGKQALTMCAGLGCNAVGVVGCRIIDSPRERLIAIITNCFVPCNGRFPSLMAMITMFFIGAAGGLMSSILSALLLTAVIVLGVVMTFVVSRLLSLTVLKGIPSSFALELPPYRRPQLGKVIVRSIIDRTFFVLGRAIVVAAPAGAVIWLAANTRIGDVTLLSYLAAWLDPFARLLGMDGVILLAFILGWPANEIVIPLIIMAYLSTGSLMELSDLSVLRDLFVGNGWTPFTAVSVILFMLMHWPCSTTCLTIYKETRSVKWTVLSIATPTLVGCLLCFVFTAVVRWFGF